MFFGNFGCVIHEDAGRVYAVLEELGSDNLFMLPTRVRDIWENIHTT